MTAVQELENADISSEPSKAKVATNRNLQLDHEADADDALRTLREFVLSDIKSSDIKTNEWIGLNSYIEELCSYGVDRLTREPEELTAACVRLKNDLEEVSCGNYRALIESFECAGAVRDGVADVRSRLDKLIVELPGLADVTKQFSIKVSQKQQERERRLRAITEHHAIADILELPRLMQALLAAELYDEALELREHTIKLTIMHPDETLIMNVGKEMHILTQQMVIQLLVLLRNTIQLPMCLRVVGFLRRLGLFSEFRLRMLFLHCRGEWMRLGMESSTSMGHQAYLVHLSDNTRAMMFEIITQYRAAFNDDIDDAEADEYTTNDTRDETYSSSILFDWTSSCIADYLEKLKDGVRHIADGAALNTVMQQAMYCGQSLGRVGADFRPSLPPIFEETVLRIYCSHLNAALRQFEMMVDDNRWAPVGSSALRKERGQLNPAERKNAEDNNIDESSDKVEQEDSTNKSFEPPFGVLDSPPLAVFLNGILAALNELRLCCPTSLGPRLGKTLRDTLLDAGKYMSGMGGPGGIFLKRSDRPHFTAMSASLRDLCVHHSVRCLEYCMDQTSLVDVEEIRSLLTEVFGETVAPTTLSEETTAKLNDIHASGTNGTTSADSAPLETVDTETSSRSQLTTDDSEKAITEAGVEPTDINEVTNEKINSDQETQPEQMPSHDFPNIEQKEDDNIIL